MLVLGKHHIAGGIRPGQVIEIDDERALRLIAAGHVTDARKLVDRDPKLAAIIENSGPGLGVSAYTAVAPTTVGTGTEVNE